MKIFGPLNIQKATKIYYDAATQSAKVIYDGQLMTPGVDYTLIVTNQGARDELVFSGCGLFGGSLKLLYNPKSDTLFRTGDFDGNLVVDTDDVVALLLHISMPDMFKLPEGVSADFTSDGAVTTDDAVKLLLHISMPDMFPL